VTGGTIVVTPPSAAPGAESSGVDLAGDVDEAGILEPPVGDPGVVAGRKEHHMGLGLGLRRRFGRCAPWLVPEQVEAAIWHRRAARRPRPELETASELWSVPSEGMRLDVCWSDVPGVGSGPSASLFVSGAEVLRLDCFGGVEGHMHLNPAQSDPIAGRVQVTPRVYFPVGSRRQHVERAAFELRQNVPAAVSTNLLPHVQRAPLDPALLATAAEQMAVRMGKLLDAHGEPPAGPAPT